MKIFVLFMLMLLPVAALAAPLMFADTEGKPRALDAFSGPRIVLLWRGDCAPCRQELKTLPSLASAHPDQIFLLIALQKEVIVTLKDAPENLHVLTANSPSNAVFKAFGNTRHALPYSASLHADGSVCKQHYGLLGSERIEQWAAICNE